MALSLGNYFLLNNLKILTSWSCLRRIGTTSCLNKIENENKESTVDQNDVNHHSKLSNIWWNTDGQIKALHSFNTLRIQLVRDGLANAKRTANDEGAHPLKGINILDVGCGGGILSEALARIGANVVGIDASEELISTAKNHATLDRDLTNRLQYIHTTVEDHKPSTGNYDAVVASEVVEHVSNPQLFLRACVDILKPGGSIFITTFNKTLPSWIGGIIFAEYLLKIIPQGTHDWNKFIPPEETQRILNECGCQTKLIHGIIYNPVTNTWSWIETTAVHYGLHAIKLPKK